MAHTEAVFFIDNDQTQILEGHIVLQQLVGTDHDIDLAVGNLVQRLALFLGGAEA